MTERIGTIVEMHRSRGRFIVAIEGGAHALFTLYDHIELCEGDQLSGPLDQVGSEWLMRERGRRVFDAFGETGPATLDECRRMAGG